MVVAVAAVAVAVVAAVVAGAVMEIRVAASRNGGHAGENVALDHLAQLVGPSRRGLGRVCPAGEKHGVGRHELQPAGLREHRVSLRLSSDVRVRRVRREGFAALVVAVAVVVVVVPRRLQRKG